MTRPFSGIDIIARGGGYPGIPAFEDLTLGLWIDIIEETRHDTCAEQPSPMVDGPVCRVATPFHWSSPRLAG